MRPLLVEDDTDLTQSLRPALERAGFAVDPSADGVDAEFRGDSEPYDVVVLDLGLPKRSGLDVLRNWRGRDNDVPVIILTAHDAWHERVDGLRAGADDYLGKPFYPEELIARIRAVVRRRHGSARADLARVARTHSGRGASKSAHRRR
jgi:two-component system, OmpR family, response regulator